jgi:hypothetical protein
MRHLRIPERCDDRVVDQPLPGKESKESSNDGERPSSRAGYQSPAVAVDKIDPDVSAGERAKVRQ